MAVTTTLYQGAGLSVIAYACDAHRGQRPFVEAHQSHSLSYVRKGSFGCTTVAGSFELVAGSILLGHPGDEYVCTHEHTEGDECLSFRFQPELVDSLRAPNAIWRKGCVEPLPGLV